MKTTLLALAASLAIAASVQPADACGGYMPELRVFRVSSHYTRAGGRAFVLMNKQDGTGHAFTQLEPMSYDSTSIAPLAAPAKWRWDVTLIGAEGTAKVSATKLVLMNDMLTGHGANTVQAAELPLAKAHEFAIAVAGTHTGLAWKPMTTSTETTTEDRAWLEANGQVAEGVDKGFTKFALPGGITGFAGYDAEAGAYSTALRYKDGQFYGTRVGMPWGVLSIDGETRIVFDNNGIESTMEVYE